MKNENLSEQERKRENRKRFEKKLNEHRAKLDQYRKEHGSKAKIPTDCNLFFLDYILKENNLTYYKAAEISGISSVLIYYWFDTDDCKISHAKRLINGIGLSLEPEIVSEEKKQSHTTDEMPEGCEIQMNALLNPKRKQNRIGYQKVLEENVKKNGDLAFLSKKILESGRSLYVISQEAGFAYAALRLFFINDDMKISKLMRICKSQGYKIRWNVNKKESKK